jgi:hypothetical protein
MKGDSFCRAWSLGSPRWCVVCPVANRGEQRIVLAGGARRLDRIQYHIDLTTLDNMEQTP